MLKKRILVVDDDKTILLATQSLLLIAGYEVFTHDTPFRTSEMIQTWRPDLVLLDVNMPGLAGDKLCALIRGNRRIQTKIFFHSSNDETSLRQAVAEFGADDYVCKGDISGLRRKVGQALMN
jgi:DNA-binding response OmpR family regulator